MPEKMNPFSYVMKDIDLGPSFEIPRISTRRETPTSRKDQRIWNELLGSPIFEQMVKEIRRRCGIRVGVAGKLFMRSVNLSLAGRPYQRVARRANTYKAKVKPVDVVPILRHFDLTPLWHLPIEEYVLNSDAKWFPPDERDTIRPILCEDSFSRKRLLVEIFANTDRSEFIRAWKGISPSQKRLPGYRAKWGRADETTLRKQIRVLLRQGRRPTEIVRCLVKELEPKGITISEKPEDQKLYDAWLNRLEALRRLVYRVAREWRVTTNVT